MATSLWHLVVNVHAQFPLLIAGQGSRPNHNLVLCLFFCTPKVACPQTTTHEGNIRFHEHFSMGKRKDLVSECQWYTWSSDGNLFRSLLFPAPRRKGSETMGIAFVPCARDAYLEEAVRSFPTGHQAGAATAAELLAHGAAGYTMWLLVGSCLELQGVVEPNVSYVTICVSTGNTTGNIC